MIEVEAKIKIQNPKEFRKLVNQLGKLIEKEEKIDDYYTLQKNKSYPRKSLRIRKKNGIHEINFKERISYKNGIHAKNEQEFQVTDINNFLALIADFGFKKWLTKIKHSEIYELKNNFHIEINHVKSLGWFLEIEYLTEKNKIEKARKEIQKIIKKLSIEKNQIIREGYTKMLWDKSGK